MEDFDEFQKAWHSLEGSIKTFLRIHLRNSEEIKDGLRLARVELFLALKRWDPQKARLNTYLLSILKHRLRDIIRFRYPVSVPAGVIEDPKKRSKVNSSFVFLAIDDHDNYNQPDVEIPSPGEPVEDAVINSIFKEKFRQDLLEIINSNYFTNKERSALLKFLEIEPPFLNIGSKTLLKLRQHLEARGYTADDFF